MPEDSESNNTATNTDFLSRFSNFVDQNLQLIQRSVYVAGAVVLIGVGRHLRLHHRFTSSSDIPPRFYQQNVKLLGTVRHRDKDTNVLSVSHIPPLPSRFVSLFTRSHKEKSNEDLLKVSIAGVQLTKSGENWIDINIVNRNVWFKLLESPENNFIPAIITCRIKKYPVRTNVNHLLVQKGFGRVLDRYDEEPTSQIYASLRSQLLSAEQKAVKKGKGDWENKSGWKKLIGWKTVKRLFKKKD